MQTQRSWAAIRSPVSYTHLYSFAPQFTDADLKKFEAGIHYGIYNKMGAHPMTVKGTAGVYFAVWAPCAMRVSVVGDFNLWDRCV